jgi:arylformamidase
MQVHLKIQDKNFMADLNQPLDISIPLRFDGVAPNCFYAPLAEASPVVAGDFVGSTAQGGLVNFMNIRLNPHGNGTHTECVGHIAREPFYLSDCLQRFHFAARLVSIYPQHQDDGDRVITRDQLAAVLRPGEVAAVVIRTLPNDAEKKSRNYSGTNPPSCWSITGWITCSSTCPPSTGRRTPVSCWPTTPFGNIPTPPAPRQPSPSWSTCQPRWPMADTVCSCR